MSGILELQKLLFIKQRRFQILAEKIACFGLSVDPSVIIEKEDIEKEISGLRHQLDALFKEKPEYDNLLVDISKLDLKELNHYFSDCFEISVLAGKELLSALADFKDQLGRFGKSKRDLSDWNQISDSLIRVSDGIRDKSEKIYVNQLNALTAEIQFFNTVFERRDVAIPIAIMEERLKLVQSTKDKMLSIQVNFLQMSRWISDWPSYTENLKHAKVSFASASELLYENFDQLIDYTWQVEKLLYKQYLMSID